MKETSTTPARLAAGLACAFGAAALFGAAPSLSAVAYHDGAGSMTLSAVRGLVMTAGFSLLALKSGIRRLDGPSLFWLFAFAASNVAFIYLYETAIRLGGPSQSLLLLFTHPILVVAIQAARGKEMLRPRHAAMAALCFVGIAIAASPWDDGFRPAGFLFGTGSSIATALGVYAYDKLNERRPGSDFLCLAAMGIGVVIAVLPAAVAIEGLQVPRDPIGWLAMVGSSIAAAAAFHLFVRGIALAGAVKAILMTNVEPIIGIGCAAAIAGERPTPHVIIGALCVIAGIIDWKSLREALAIRKAPEPAFQGK